MSASGIRAGQAFVEFTLADEKFQKQFTKFRQDLRAAGSALRGFGTTSLAAGGAIVAAFAGPIQAASDAQEAMSKFSVVFGDLEGEAMAFADQLADTIGRSRYEVAANMAAFQDLFVPMGVAKDDAFELSKQMVTLAEDLGSFNNLDTADVIRDLQAAMTGSGETMKKYGVVLSQEAIKEKLEELGMEATTANKVFAAQAIIMASTSAAQGDAARTAGGFANRLKALQGAANEAAVAIGTPLLGPLEKLLGVVQPLVVSVGNWVAQNETLTVGLLGAGGLAVAIGAVATALGLVIGAMTTLMAHPFILGIAGITIAVGALASQYERIETAVRNWLQVQSTSELTGPERFEQSMRDLNEAPLSERAAAPFTGFGSGFLNGIRDIFTGASIGSGTAAPEMGELIDLSARQLATNEALLRAVQNSEGGVFA